MTRTAEELGAGLEPIRDARAIRHGERIHVVGAAGAGASAAALLASAAGAAVSGCDPGGPSPYTPALEAGGIPLAWTHDAAHVRSEPHPDRLAVTKALTAIEADHPELTEAAVRGIPAEPWQQVVADAATGRDLIAVAGTHGKSTTAGWLTWVLDRGGLDPAAFVGALLPAALTGGVPATARQGRGAPFVVEADEYAGNFDAYRPNLVLLTTVEWDHPDVFADRDAVIEAFVRWLGRVPDAGVVGNVGDPGVADLLRRLSRHRTGRTVLTAVVDPAPPNAGGQKMLATFGADAAVAGRIVAADRDGTTLALSAPDLADPIEIRLPTTGAHNASNALVVAAAAVALGLDVERVASGLGTFPGIGRRLERKGEAGGVVVYDDYGHHPTAIRATIAALRQREPGRRLWAVYEPLTFHRTAALLDDFADALTEADAVAVADIWASRDPDTTVTSPRALTDAVHARRPGMPAEAPGSVEDTAAWLATQVEPGDAVLVMGGGHSYRIAELLVETLQRRPA
jgi:UDP-N-acetylmuramate--alanine ligase